jgi:hypothetical protein
MKEAGGMRSIVMGQESHHIGLTGAEEREIPGGYTRANNCIYNSSKIRSCHMTQIKDDWRFGRKTEQ